MSVRYRVRVAFLDVGQGATTVVSIPETGEAVVIDCLDADSALTYLKDEGITRVRGLLITHLHLDHYAGALRFLENCALRLKVDCERLVLNWCIPSVSHFASGPLSQDDHSDGSVPAEIRASRRKTVLQNLSRWVNSHRDTKPLSVMPAGGPLLPGSVNDVLELIHPLYNQQPTLQMIGYNNTCGVLKIRGLGTSALLTSDIEPQGWRVLLENGGIVQSDVLSFPHHGAWKGADAGALLDAVAPSIVVISVGTEGEKYQHPGARVFHALRERPFIRLMCTQATRACETGVEDTRAAIVALLRSQTHHRDFIGSKTGCPCAGTIIIDLDERVRVVQPDLDFHRRSIIEPHFRTHQCHCDTED